MFQVCFLAVLFDGRVLAAGVSCGALVWEGFTEVQGGWAGIEISTLHAHACLYI